MCFIIHSLSPSHITMEFDPLSNLCVNLNLNEEDRHPFTITNEVEGFIVIMGIVMTPRSIPQNDIESLF